MSYMKNLILIATIIFVGIFTSNASADADDFNLDFDDPASGESSLDPDNTIEMKVQIENGPMCDAMGSLTVSVMIYHPWT